MIYLITILWAMLIFIGSSTPGPELPSAPSIISYLVHFFEFGILGILLTKSITGIRQTPLPLPHSLRESLGGRQRFALYNEQRRFDKLGVTIVFTIGFLYALSDETHQLFVPGRSFEILDLLIDSLGLLIGIIIILKKSKKNYESCIKV